MAIRISIPISTPPFTLLPVDDIWVDANFKETQLAHIVAGAAAAVTFDVPAGRKFAAHVEAIGAGNESELSLLHAQNATGNWDKITQRVPVRVMLDNPAEAAPIASGMSATVAFETGVTRQWADLLPATLTGK